VDLETAKLNLERAYAYHPLDVNNTYELANIYARSGSKRERAGDVSRALDPNSGYDEIYSTAPRCICSWGKNPERSGISKDPGDQSASREA